MHFHLWLEKDCGIELEKSKKNGPYQTLLNHYQYTTQTCEHWEEKCTIKHIKQCSAALFHRKFRFLSALTQVGVKKWQSHFTSLTIHWFYFVYSLLFRHFLAKIWRLSKIRLLPVLSRSVKVYLLLWVHTQIVQRLFVSGFNFFVFSWVLSSCIVISGIEVERR